MSPQIGLNGRWGRRCWDCSHVSRLFPPARQGTQATVYVPFVAVKYRHRRRLRPAPHLPMATFACSPDPGGGGNTQVDAQRPSRMTGRITGSPPSPVANTRLHPQLRADMAYSTVDVALLRHIAHYSAFSAT